MVNSMSTKLKPDIIADIRFLTPDEGGSKKMPLGTKEHPFFGCPLEFEGKHFDCRLLLDEIGTIELGTHVNAVPIKFLSELLKGRLAVGSQFTLWERGKFAEGVVTRLCWNGNE